MNKTELEKTQEQLQRATNIEDVRLLHSKLQAMVLCDDLEKMEEKDGVDGFEITYPTSKTKKTIMHLFRAVIVGCGSFVSMWALLKMGYPLVENEYKFVLLLALSAYPSCVLANKLINDE